MGRWGSGQARRGESEMIKIGAELRSYMVIFAPFGSDWPKID